ARAARGRHERRRRVRRRRRQCRRQLRRAGMRRRLSGDERGDGARAVRAGAVRGRARRRDRGRVADDLYRRAVRADDSDPRHRRRHDSRVVQHRVLPRPERARRACGADADSGRGPRVRQHRARRRRGDGAVDRSVPRSADRRPEAVPEIQAGRRLARAGGASGPAEPAESRRPAAEGTAAPVTATRKEGANLTKENRVMRSSKSAMLAALAAVGSGAAAAQECDRACIIGITDAYLAAIAANDPSAAPLADDIVFVENVTRMKPGEGLWASATGGPTDFAIYVPDPVLQSAGWMGVVERDDEPVLLALRLAIEGGEIT